MVSFNTFKQLPRDMQAEALLQWGVYLDLIRRTSRLSIELYAMDGFYVEIYFDKIRDDPLFLKAFDSMEELEPYLPLIEIDSLFETHKIKIPPVSEGQLSKAFCLGFFSRKRTPFVFSKDWISFLGIRIQNGLFTELDG